MQDNYEHKDSGIEWLGEVPEKWLDKRLRYCLKLNPSKQEIRHLPKDTELSFIPMEAVGEDGSIDLSNTRPIEDVENGYTYFRNYDVAIAKITPCFENGKGCIFRNLVHNHGFGTTELTVMRPKLLVPTYLYYITISHRFRTTGIGLMQGSAGQKRVPDDYIRDYLIGLPSEAEQHSIVSFLDRETARIDSLIQKKERMIELLKEKRIALITQTVTKGLDPCVPMKDSGIEWLGKVPEHWGKKRIKDLLLPKKGAIKTGPFGSQLLSSEMDDSDVKVYNQKSVITKDFESGENYISFKKLETLKEFQTYPGDFLITTRGTIGRCAILPPDSETGILHPCLMRLQTNKEIVDDRFLELLIEESQVVIEQLKLKSNGTTIEVIYQDSLKNVTVFLPPIHEQLSIADYLDMKTNKTDLLIYQIETSISLLREYRASLIHHAVTGKIDLRGYDAQAQ